MVKITINFIIVMRVTCQIWNGQLRFSPSLLGKGFGLHNLEPYATHYYQHRPRMIKYRCSRRQITLLIFTNFRFRLMGGGEEHMLVLHEFLHSLPWRDAVDVVGEVCMSNMTVTHQLPYDNINLHTLAQRETTRFRAELELFPAAQWLHGQGGEHVNIFHTGRVVITGVQSINKAERLLRELQSQLEETALVCLTSTSLTFNTTTAPPPPPTPPPCPSSILKY
jgi:TATA-box binding protein (TBP) (component of TFIID and TFIIIB)